MPKDNYMSEEDGRWNAFSRFLDDGRICLTNNAAERALRGIALGRKAWLFAGSPRGGDLAAFMYSLIVTAKMNDVDPQAWLADVLGPTAGNAPVAPARTPSVALEGTKHGSVGLNMQSNKIHAIKTVDRLAAELGETVDWPYDLAIGSHPKTA